MEKVKTPLQLLTLGFVVAFFDGVFSFGMSDNAYAFIGVVELVALIWLWVAVRRASNKKTCK